VRLGVCLWWTPAQSRGDEVGGVRVGSGPRSESAGRGGCAAVLPTSTGVSRRRYRPLVSGLPTESFHRQSPGKRKRRRRGPAAFL